MNLATPYNEDTNYSKSRPGNPRLGTLHRKRLCIAEYRRQDVSERYLSRWGVMEYFHRDLLNSCDILLSLDDQNGSHLPVHSQVLARCSPVLREMMKKGLLTSATPSQKIIVPFGDCTREEAISFLSIVYSLRPHEYVDETSALSVARLGDKYGVKVCAQYSREKIVYTHDFL